MLVYEPAIYHAYFPFIYVHAIHLFILPTFDSLTLPHPQLSAARKERGEALGY